MNFREGMRRIGLTVGGLGALVTALAAFGLFFSDLADRRKVQAEFSSLLKLPIVARTMAKKKTIAPNSSEPQNWDTTNEIKGHLADGTVLHFPGGTDPHVIHDIVQKQYGQIPASAPSAQRSNFDPLEPDGNAVVAKKKISGAYDQTQVPSFDDFVKERQRNEPTSAYVEIQGHPQGIRQVWVDEKGEIAWFEMDDGRTIMRTSGPTSLFWYLLYPPIIAVGFVVPWGAVRLVTWIVSGFIRGGATAPQKA